MNEEFDPLKFGASKPSKEDLPAIRNRPGAVVKTGGGGNGDDFDPIQFGAARPDPSVVPLNQTDSTLRQPIMLGQHGLKGASNSIDALTTLMLNQDPAAYRGVTDPYEQSVLTGQPPEKRDKSFSGTHDVGKALGLIDNPKYKPRNSGEAIAAAGAEGAGATLGIGGVPGVVGGGAGQAAAETYRQYVGHSPTTEFLLSIIGSLFGGKITNEGVRAKNTIRSKLNPGVGDELPAVYKRQNVPLNTLGTATQDEGVQGIEAAMRQNIPGRKTLLPAVKEQIAGLEGAIDRKAGELGSVPGYADQIGSYMTNLLDRIKTRTKGRTTDDDSIVKRIYDALDEVVPGDTQIPLNNYIAAFSRVRSPIPELENTQRALRSHSTVLDNLWESLQNDLTNSPNGTVPYTAIKNIRTELNKRIQDETVPSVKGDLRQLAVALKSDMRQGFVDMETNMPGLRVVGRTPEEISADIEASVPSGPPMRVAPGTPGVTQPTIGSSPSEFFDKSHDYIRSVYYMHDKIINPLLEKEAANKVFNEVINSGIRKNGSPEELLKFRDMVINPAYGGSPEAWKNVVSGVYRRLGQDSNDYFNPNLFFRNWQNMPETSKKALFGNTPLSALSKDYDDIARIAESISTSSKFNNFSNTGGAYELSTLFGGSAFIGASFLTQNPSLAGVIGGATAGATAAATRLVGQHIVARLLTWKPFVNYIAHPAGHVNNRVQAMTGLIAQAEHDGYGDELMAFTGALDQSFPQNKEQQKNYEMMQRGEGTVDWGLFNPVKKAAGGPVTTNGTGQIPQKYPLNGMAGGGVVKYPQIPVHDETQNYTTGGVVVQSQASNALNPAGSRWDLSAGQNYKRGGMVRKGVLTKANGGFINRPNFPANPVQSQLAEEKDFAEGGAVEAQDTKDTKVEPVKITFTPTMPTGGVTLKDLAKLFGEKRAK